MAFPGLEFKLRHCLSLPALESVGEGSGLGPDAGIPRLAA